MTESAKAAKESSDSEIGQEAAALGIFDQMQNARKEVALGLGAADVDECLRH
jgi:hypothetical protein